MSRADLLRLLGDRLGLDPASMGERVVDHSLGQARERLGLADDAALWRSAQQGGAALTALFDAFLVPETWFFRSPEQFRELVEFARGAVRERRPLRVLSLPCSTGEEAWSAAVSLLEAGLSPGEIDVLGIDLNAAALAHAARGQYRADNPRRPLPAAPWFEVEGGFGRVSPSLARCVRFRQGNALDPQLFAGNERFDVVFCRHLLIYLHADARRVVLTQLSRVLNPPALVLAGQAELLNTMLPGFAPLSGGSPLSFVWSGRDPPLRTAPPPAPASRPASVKPPPASAASPPTPSPSIQPDKAAGRADSAKAVASAQQLADAGEHLAARAACLAQLKQRPDDAALLFLLAGLESAAGDLAAADAALGRVLYLEPEHLDALEHRAALARRLGRDEEAVRLRQRLQRLRQRRGERA